MAVNNRRSLLLAAGLWTSAELQAHSFAEVITLPLPFWLYAWGSAAALLLSFLLLALLGGQPSPCRAGRDVGQHRLIRLLRASRLKPLLQLLGVAALLLCIATGLWGNRSPYGNFNMTFFWIVFLLGFSYASALLGNFYAALNPWRSLCAGVNALLPAYDRPRLQWPHWLGYWPALALYMGLIWLELLGPASPYTLSTALLGYSLLNLVAVATFGSDQWFRYGELFSVLFGLLAQLSPVDYRPARRGGAGHWRLRRPLTGLLTWRVSHVSLLAFILFMLSSTAFDGLHETLIWKKWFWLDLYQQLLRPLTSYNPLAAFPQMRQWFVYWQNSWLLLSLAVYLVAYLLALMLGRWLAGGRSLRELALHFAPALLPIVLVYHFAHYYTLIQTQGVKIISLISDPFGRGDNFFGTAQWLQRQLLPDTTTVWHVQLASILLGHMASVWIAHRLAQRYYRTPRQVVLSQLPILVLMLLLTTGGLWILSQPR